MNSSNCYISQIYGLQAQGSVSCVIHPLPATGQTDITIKTVNNPQYFQNLQFDYEINNSNIKKFQDGTKSNILLFTLVVGVIFLLTFGPLLCDETYWLIHR